MSSSQRENPVELAAGVIGNWKETYQWIPIFSAFAAFAVSFSSGANNLPASFSAPIGSGAISFLKVSMIAFMIYVLGAGFASNNGFNVVLSDFIREEQPNQGFLMWSMAVVLITTSLWLALATHYELPVSAKQSMQGALLGTMLVTEGFKFIPLWNKGQNHNFYGGGLLWIFLEWTAAPLIACAFAFCVFCFFKAQLFHHENAEKRILIFLPFYYAIAAGLLSFFIVFQVLPNVDVAVYEWLKIVSIVLATLIGALSSLVVVVPLARKRFESARNFKACKRENSQIQRCLENQEQRSDVKVEEEDNGREDEEVEEALKEFMQMRCLDTVFEEDERSWASPEPQKSIVTKETLEEEDHSPPSTTTTDATTNTGHSTPFRNLLRSTSTPNRLTQTRNFKKIKKTTPRKKAYKFVKDSITSTLFPEIEYGRQTLVRHALAEKFDEIEDAFGFPLLLASCIFALIQSASEIATLVSPLQVIVDVYNHRSKYSGEADNLGYLKVDWWFRALAGLGATMGFFLCGWRLTQCLGTKLTYISNSRGVAAQLSATATVIIMTRLKLPVSSVHAFVGSLVGVGIADEAQNVNWKLLIKFLCGWVMSIVVGCLFSYLFYSFTIHSPSYVVP